jgi:hypothetical protein
MNKLIFLFIFSAFSLSSLHAYKIIYAEQWYKLYHQHLYRYPEDEWQNLVFLEEALKAPFANPLYALAKIENELQWERYRYLFKLHSNLQIVRTYIQLAVKYDKKNAYFFNAPWREQNLQSLDIAQKYYERALYFWQEALVWAEQAGDARFRWIDLPEINFWQDELRAINDKSLDFSLIINKHLEKLEATRAAFEAMDENTY